MTKRDVFFVGVWLAIAIGAFCLSYGTGFNIWLATGAGLLSATELARIQSFPDRYRFHGKRAVLSKKLSLRKGLLDDVFLDQRFQVGNAVPPLLAQRLGEAVLAALTRSQAA